MDTRKISFDLYPDVCKIHRNPHFTQVFTGYPKIDLLHEERERAACKQSRPILLLYPTHTEVAMQFQKISAEKYVEIWSGLISEFLDWQPNGLVVFRPHLVFRTHPILEKLKAKLANENRFVIDAQDDNKYWLARATYFVTDYSEAYTNFCLSALRPAIRFQYSYTKTKPEVDEWGWVIRDKKQLIPLLEEMEREEQNWAQALETTRQREMPAFGKSFATIGEMLRRILNNNDDPAWHREDKGSTPSGTPADRLKLIARCVKRKNLNLYYIFFITQEILQTVSMKDAPQIYLLLLQRFLQPDLDSDSEYERDRLPYVGAYIKEALNHALAALPFQQVIGVLRHCMRKNPQLTARGLLSVVIANHVRGKHKKQALFFLLLELDRLDKQTLEFINSEAEKMPQHFSMPVLKKLNKFLPIAMKVPLPLRRLAVRLLISKIPLAQTYWAHRKLS